MNRANFNSSQANRTRNPARVWDLETSGGSWYPSVAWYLEVVAVITASSDSCHMSIAIAAFLKVLWSQCHKHKNKYRNFRKVNIFITSCGAKDAMTPVAPRSSTLLSFVAAFNRKRGRKGLHFIALNYHQRIYKIIRNNWSGSFQRCTSSRKQKESY